MSIDCSPAAVAERNRQIAELRARIATGVTSISDRSRSVSYANPQWLMQLLGKLEAERDYCMGRESGRGRIVHIPLVKGL